MVLYIDTADPTAADPTASDPTVSDHVDLVLFTTADPVLLNADGTFRRPPLTRTAPFTTLTDDQAGAVADAVEAFELALIAAVCARHVPGLTPAALRHAIAAAAA